ncbi:MAG: hypothetical protein MJZ43_05955, partial [Bacteroidaceae bacterium]|nr:hypothetical protein [Bacteroidaceae bacterium]
MKSTATTIMRRLIGILLPILFILPQPLCAGDYSIKTNTSHWSTLTPSKPMLAFNVLLGEDNDSGSRSYDDDYQVSLWDYRDPLKIQVDNCAPLDMNHFFSGIFRKVGLENRNLDYLLTNNKGRVHFYEDNREKWIGSATTANGDVITVGYIWKGSKNDYYIHVEVYFRNNYPGFRHKVTFSGGWIRDAKEPQHIIKTFQDDDIPAIADPFEGTPSCNLTGRNGDLMFVQTKFTASANATLSDSRLRGGYKIYLYDTSLVDRNFDLTECNNGRFTAANGGERSLDLAGAGKEVTNTLKFGLAPSISHHCYVRIVQNVSGYSNFVYDCVNVASNTARFIRDIGDFWVNCYPTVAGLSCKFDKWSKKVTLNWKSKIADKEHATTKGRWVIFRKKGSLQEERLGEVPCQNNTDTDKASYSFTDDGKSSGLIYDGNYCYYVCFEAEEWPEKLAQSLLSLRSEVSVRTDRNFNINLTAKGTDTSVKVEWTHPQLSDAGTAHSYIASLYRWKEGEKGWTKITEQSIKSKSVNSGSYEDKDIATCEQAKYYLSIDDVLGIRIASDTLEPPVAALTDSTRILSFVSTRGDYSSKVSLNWKLSIAGSNPVTSQILRRIYGSRKNWNVLYTVENSTNTSFSYVDEQAAPGTYYEYKLVCSTACGLAEKQCEESVDGFALSSGIMNGRISFGSGTAVDSVRVVLQPNGDNAPSIFHAMKSYGRGAGSYMAWQPQPGTVGNLLNGKPWTVQLYVKPEAQETTMTLGELGGFALLGLVADSVAQDDGPADAVYHPAIYINGVAHIADTLNVRPDQWQQLSFSLNPKAGEWSIALYQGRDTALSSQSGVLDSTASYAVSDNQVVFANDHTLKADNSLAGLIDEIRLFAGHTLSPSEISRLADHRLAGTERDLALYWHLDEGLNSQPLAYDYSSADGTRNNRHGVIHDMATTTDTPPDALFSLSGLTDSEGNYSIHGIPFSGSGSNYSVIPVLGGHEFSPSSVSRYVSANSLVHNGLDFTDVSSFKVTGSVRFDRTDIPVSDVEICVDGVPASRGGKIITTNGQGEFTVDVPIGSHFISVQKQGHEFCDGGRYPADTDGSEPSRLFDRNLSGLEFRDSTLVTVAGRVVGGDRESGKSLGFGTSVANIGQAVITLKVDGDKSFNMEKQQDEASVKLVPATSRRNYGRVNEAVESEAYTEAATDGNPTPTHYITIKTDPLTGEFTAKLPPLLYKVQSVENKAYSFSNTAFADIDASDPNALHIDTLLNHYTQEVDTFRYCASFKQTYKSRPQLHIEQLRLDTQDLPWDGHFGDSLYIYREEREGGSGEIDSTYVCLYTSTTDADGNRSVQYTFGHPIFTQLGNYGFSLRAYEEYINKDADPNDRKKWVIDHLPLEGDTVKIANAFSASTAVGQDNNDYILDNSDGTVALDAEGYGEYYFVAGFPNLAEPYTWPFSAVLRHDDDTYEWDEGTLSQAVVIGNKPFGNNFLLSAPDKMEMVLRDPPGSKSFATWEKGSSTTKYTTYTHRGYTDNKLTVSIKRGINTEVLVGAMGTYLSSKIEATSITDVENATKASGGSGHSEEETHTLNQSVSTATGGIYDGYRGDVFIATSRNLIIGQAVDVDIHRRKNSQGRDEYYLDKQEVLTTRDSITSSFTVTERYIEKELLPQYAKERNQLIEEPTADLQPLQHRSRYVSLVPKSDPNFGQPDTYKWIAPSSDINVQDTVAYFNCQIKNWKSYLALNEKAKLNAIRSRNDSTLNITFSAGTSYASKVVRETSTTKDAFVADWKVGVPWTLTTGIRLNSVGLVITENNETGYKASYSSGKVVKHTNTISYTLQDDDPYDYYTVDIYPEPADGHGPIFITRAAATSCPYEDEVTARYLTDEDAGAVISPKTIPVLEPQLTIQNPVITGIPSGKSALLTLQLYNNSGVDKEGTFSLYTTEATNPHGLRLLMDGKPLDRGRSIRVPAHRTIYKTIELLQTDPEITDYDSIALNFGPECESLAYYSRGYFSVHYLASGTTVDLAATTG